MAGYKVPVSIVIRRTAPNAIEYTVTHHDPLGEFVRVWHANRAATFFGAHTGLTARQREGEVRSLWRGDDVEMLKAFQREYNGDRIRNIVVEQ